MNEDSKPIIYEFISYDMYRNLHVFRSMNCIIVKWENEKGGNSLSLPNWKKYKITVEEIIEESQA